MNPSATRRRFVLASGAVGAGLLLAGCEDNEAGAGCQPKAVTADEDLMREHGVLRRCLLIYAECAVRLSRDAASVPGDALGDTAKLFRRFGEDYHQRRLEEGIVFPALRRLGAPASRYLDILTAQHERGRAITDFILAATGNGRVADLAGPLARAMSAFAWMYENHAAREDTIVFPGWKEALSDDQYLEASSRFQQVEQMVFGEDGFRDAAARVAAIEDRLGMSDIARFTAPPPRV
jgi:hemerythrin-like domain-containing protein